MSVVGVGSQFLGPLTDIEVRVPNLEAAPAAKWAPSAGSRR